MMEIKNDRDYRTGYELLSILIQADQNGFADSERAKDCIVGLKRKLRAYAHRDCAVDVGMGFMVNRRIVRDEGMDGYLEVVSLPDVFDTAEMADEFFKDFLYKPYAPSAYDCTGQAFTIWYKLFVRHGHYHAYHCVGVDI